MKKYLLTIAICLLTTSALAEELVVQQGVGDSPVDIDRLAANAKFVPGEVYYKLNNGKVKQLSEGDLWRKRVSGSSTRFGIPGGGDSGGGDAGGGAGDAGGGDGCR